MTFWDYAHLHPIMVAFGITACLVVAFLAFVAVEDWHITRQNIERFKAIGRGGKP